MFSTSAAAKKGVQTIVGQNGSSLDLGAFGAQLTPLESMYYLDLITAKENRSTESALCATQEKSSVGSLY